MPNNEASTYVTTPTRPKGWRVYEIYELAKPCDYARNGGGIRTIKKGGPFFFAIATRTKDFKYIKINKKIPQKSGE